MLAVAEMLVQLGGLEALEEQQRKLKNNIKSIKQNISWQEWKLCIPAIFRGTLVGSTVGILPGLGASVASFLSYGLAKKAAKEEAERLKREAELKMDRAAYVVAAHPRIMDLEKFRLFLISLFMI